MPKKPSVDVLGRESFPVEVPGFGVVAGHRVIGKITLNRSTLCYEIKFLRDASSNIKRAKPDQMLHAIEILDQKITQIAETINKVLNEAGDTDPRHTEYP